MSPNPYAARHELRCIRIAIGTGAPLTQRMKERSLLALHQVRDAEGPRAAANERVRLQLVVLTTAAKRLRTKSTRRTGSDAPAVSRGGVAHPSMGRHGTVVKQRAGTSLDSFRQAVSRA